MEKLVYTLNQFATKIGVSIKIVNQKFENTQEKLVAVLIQIVTVFSAKLNGKRKNKVQNFKKDLEDE